MKNEIEKMMGALYEPFVTIGVKLGDAIADAIDKAFDNDNNQK